MASKFKQKVIKDLEANGHLVIGLIRANGSGYADLLAIKDGICTFIEVKEKTDTIKALQLFRGREVEKYGAKFMVVQDK